MLSIVTGETRSIPADSRFATFHLLDILRNSSLEGKMKVLDAGSDDRALIMSCLVGPRDLHVLLLSYLSFQPSIGDSKAASSRFPGDLSRTRPGLGSQLQDGEDFGYFQIMPWDETSPRGKKSTSFLLAKDSFMN